MNHLALILSLLLPAQQEAATPGFAYPEEPIIVEKITVAGNRITRENRILRELTFLPGDTVTAEEVATSTKALMSTGAFGDADVEVLTPLMRESEVLVTVSERRYPLPYPIVGIDASSGFYLGAGALYPNLFGRTIHVDAGGEVGLRFRKTPRYKWYTFIEAPLTYSRWHAERTAYTYTDFWRKDAAITRREHRASYKQSVRPWRPLRLSLEGGWLQTRAFSPDSVCELPTFCPDTIDQSFFIQPGMVLDFRDDASYPTKGILLAGSFFYNPGLKTSFKTQRACSLSIAGYLPIGERNVLAANLWTYQQIDSIPIYRTLYIGEAHILRGWADTTQVGPALTVGSIEFRRKLADMSLENVPLIGDMDIWWAASAFVDIAATHAPGMPPLYFADPSQDTHDGLLAATGLGIALGLPGGFIGKAEIAYGIGSKTGAIPFIPIPIRFPLYFGWRF